MAFRLSNNVIGALNLVTLLLSAHPRRRDLDGHPRRRRRVRPPPLLAGHRAGGGPHGRLPRGPRRRVLPRHLAALGLPPRHVRPHRRPPRLHRLRLCRHQPWRRRDRLRPRVGSTASGTTPRGCGATWGAARTGTRSGAASPAPTCAGACRTGTRRGRSSSPTTSPRSSPAAASRPRAATSRTAAARGGARRRG
uniref:Uncharacterized protein n=1 Tax=Oryza glaberrima TaxID=4538 RepID=I1QJ28_ORYGL